MPVAWVSVGFQSLPLLHTGKLGPSCADSWVCGFVYILGLCGSLQWTLLWGWDFLPPLQFPQVFSARGFEALFPCSGTLDCAVYLASQLLLLVYRQANVGPPSLPVAALLCVLSTPAAHLPLLPVWMNVSSLTPWMSDFHTVWFYGSSGCFLLLNCCCPSFGCARRKSVSTYASILAGSIYSCV